MKYISYSVANVLCQLLSNHEFLMRNDASHFELGMSRCKVQCLGIKSILLKYCGDILQPPLRR